MLLSEFYFSKCIIHLSCVLLLHFWFENFLTVQKQHIIFVKKVQTQGCRKIDNWGKVVSRCSCGHVKTRSHEAGITLSILGSPVFKGIKKMDLLSSRKFIHLMLCTVHFEWKIFEKCHEYLPLEVEVQHQTSWYC